ncbi:MAG: sarcosine oxidase subunit gamma [Microgenomates group bacterium]
MDNFAAHFMKPLSPLGHITAQTEVIGPVTITENTGVALASLASRMGQEKAVAKAAKAAGIPQPGPGIATVAAVYGAFWLGPEQWMIEAPFASHEDVVSILKPLFGETASLTEQTDAWVRFDLEGADLPKLFERLCGFDLRAAGTGAATRTMIEHLGCYVVLRQMGDGTDRVSVYGPRSSAHSLHHALITAAKSAF